MSHRNTEITAMILDMYNCTVTNTVRNPQPPDLGLTQAR